MKTLSKIEIFMALENRAKLNELKEQISFTYMRNAAVTLANLFKIFIKI